MEVNKTKFERVIVIVEFRSQFSNASFKKKELVNKILRKKKQKKKSKSQNVLPCFLIL